MACMTRLAFVFEIEEIALPDHRPERHSESRRRNESRPIPQPDHPIAFLRGFLERPKQVGSIIPSSRWMERRITRTAELANARLVIELGPGTGGTTRALLQAMRPDATLLAIEINPGFCELLRETIDDRRLIVHEGSAAEISDALTKHEQGAPDVVLSGIPFSTMPRSLGLAILHSVRESLAPGGSRGRRVLKQVRHRRRQRALRLGRSRSQRTPHQVPVPRREDPGRSRLSP